MKEWKSGRRHEEAVQSTASEISRVTLKFLQGGRPLDSNHLKGNYVTSQLSDGTASLSLRSRRLSLPTAT